MLKGASGESPLAGVSGLIHMVRNRSPNSTLSSAFILLCGSSALAFPEAGLTTGLATGCATGGCDDSWAMLTLLRDVAAVLLGSLVAFACIRRSGRLEPGGGCAPQPHATT